MLDADAYLRAGRGRETSRSTAVLPPTAGTRWGWWRIFARVGWTGPLSPVTRQDPLAPPRKTSAVPRKRHHRSFGKLFK